MSERGTTPEEASPPAGPRSRITPDRIILLLQLVMLVALVWAAWEGRWFSVFLIAGIVGLTTAPALLGRRFRVDVPPEFEALAIIFIFASLFLGEIGDYYNRFWWWDIVLHTGSGLLLGILGFLLLYLLNASDRIHLDMRPGFMAFFAFCFAMAVGGLWEIFEYAMDTLFGMNMQKPMLGDDSGLTDTMWDLIVDALGALVISLMGYVYTRLGADYFVSRWIAEFVRRNPRLFGKGKT